MKKVAVIEGGYSKEKAISIKSAQTVFDNLDRNKFAPVRVLIDEHDGPLMMTTEGILLIKMNLVL